MKSLLVALVLFPMLPIFAVAQEGGTVTFVESALRVIRGATVYLGAEGVRLRQGDILENGEGGFAQLELSGGTIAVLGPSSRIFLFRLGSGAEIVLLSGWLKGEGGTSSGVFRYSSPLLSASTRSGTVVVRSGEEVAEMFVESDSANVSPVSPDGNWGHPVSVRSGQFCTRQRGKNVTVSPRPPTTFLDQVPHAFRDTLPSRLERFSNKKPVELRRDHEVSFGEIQGWLMMAPRWSTEFVERFQSRLKDPAFREELEKHLSALPEWEPVLHPEKNAPKTQEPR